MRRGIEKVCMSVRKLIVSNFKIIDSRGPQADSLECNKQSESDGFLTKKNGARVLIESHLGENDCHQHHSPDHCPKRNCPDDSEFSIIHQHQYAG